MFYITYYQTLIKNTPFPPKQPPTSTTLLQHHVSNHLTNSPNTTFPINQPTANTNNTFQTNTFQTARFKHLYYTPRNAPSFRFQPPPSGTWFSAITPLPPSHPPSTGAQPLHPYSRSSSFTWFSAITPLPPVFLLQLVLSHYTLTAGLPPSTGSQPLHLYRRSSSFNWFSAITLLPTVILLQLVLRTGKRVYRDQSLFVCSEISDEAIIV